MIKFLYKINKAYDNLPEPKRFLIFMAMILPAILMTGVTPYPQLMLVGWVWILIMLTSRMIVMHGVFKPKEPPTESGGRQRDE